MTLIDSITAFGFCQEIFAGSFCAATTAGRIAANFDGLANRWTDLVKQANNNFKYVTEQAEGDTDSGVQYHERYDRKGNKYWRIETNEDIFIKITDNEKLQGIAFAYILGERNKKTVLYATNGKTKKVGNVKVNSLEILSRGSRQNSDFAPTIPQNAPVVKPYEKKNAISKLLFEATKSESVGKGGIYYWDKNKARNLANGIGVQFPGSSTISNGFMRSIYDPLSKVNPRIKNNYETKQFKRWFGKSAAVNPDGTPKVLYHGTEDTFSVFDASEVNAPDRTPDQFSSTSPSPQIIAAASG